MLIAAGAECVSAALARPLPAMADESAADAADLVKELIGETAVESGRVHLDMPKQFPTGYTVPLSLKVDSAMTADDHVRHVRVLAPRNPIVEVLNFQVVPNRSEARVETRIRLAQPQFVVAVAEMHDGTFLMAKTWVAVATNGCS